jgi:hypothetical protein
MFSNILNTLFVQGRIVKAHGKVWYLLEHVSDNLYKAIKIKGLNENGNPIIHCPTNIKIIEYVSKYVDKN